MKGTNQHKCQSTAHPTVDPPQTWSNGGCCVAAVRAAIALPMVNNFPKTAFYCMHHCAIAIVTKFAYRIDAISGNLP
jgi:hypothetical protein